MELAGAWEEKVASHRAPHTHTHTHTVYSLSSVPLENTRSPTPAGGAAGDEGIQRALGFLDTQLQDVVLWVWLAPS